MRYEQQYRAHLFQLDEGARENLGVRTSLRAVTIDLFISLLNYTTLDKCIKYLALIMQV